MAIQYPLRNQKDLRLLIDFNNRVTDQSPYGNDGTWYGSTTSRYVSGPSSDFGQAGTFNGIDDWCFLGNIYQPRLTSFSFWIRTTLDGDHFPFGWGGYFGRIINGTIRISTDGGSVGAAETTTRVDDGNWHFVAFTNEERLARKQKIYLNGILEDEATELPNAPTPRDFHLSNWGASWFDGELDDFRMYAYILSADEVFNMYQLGYPPRTTPEGELLFYEDFSAGKIPEDWIVESGSFVVVLDETTGEYYLECLTAGVLGIPVPNAMQDMSVTGLEWEWDMWHEEVSETDFIFVASDVEPMGANQDGYSYRFNSVERVQLRRSIKGGATGSLQQTDPDYISTQTWYTCKVTKESTLFELFVDGTSVFTDIDGSHTTTKCLVFDPDVGDRVKNIRVRRF